MTDVFLCLSQSPGQDYFILDIFSSSDQIFLKKHLTNAPGYSIITKRFEEVATIQSFGRLAQLVEHLLDVQVVSGSIPLTSTKLKATFLVIISQKMWLFLVYNDNVLFASL